jgi:hypothetical protein
MRHLLFLSITSALLAPGCGDDSCGPGDAPAYGLLASNADVTLTYGNLSAGANNDCPAADAPSGVISMTIDGTQKDGTSLITFCVPRPDKLASGLQLGSEFKIIDFNGELDGCTYAFEGGVPAGMVTASGICDNGTNDAGFALTFDGNFVLRQTCQTATNMIALSLSGTVAVAAK